MAANLLPGFETARVIRSRVPGDAEPGDPDVAVQSGFAAVERKYPAFALSSVGYRLLVTLCHPERPSPALDQA
jgi:hypothetical protein